MTIDDRDTATEPLRYRLPAEAYTSQSWFDREQTEIFERAWLFAGVIDELQRPGDYVTLSAGRIPLVVVRQRGGTLAAFHNVCRHRGAVMYDGAGNAGEHLRCFYHAWSYDLDGGLRRTPQPDQFPCLDRGSLALRPASVDTTNGMVFASADPHAAPLADHLGGLVARLGPYRPGDLLEIQRRRYPMRANWKLFMENHIDGYHLWHLHSASIKGLDHARQRSERCGRNWTFYEPTRGSGVSVDERGTGLAVIDHIDDEHWYGSAVHHLFPNLGLATQATYWTTILAIPVGPDQTVLETRFRVMPQSKARFAALSLAGKVDRAARALGRKLDALRGADRSAVDDKSFADVVDEDIRAAEAVQRGMGAPTTTIGPLARDHERAIAEFQQDVVDALDGHEPSTAPTRSRQDSNLRTAD